jgi:recombination protein RecA
MAKAKKLDVPVPTGLLTPEQKRSAVDAAMGNVEKLFGAGAIQRFGQTSPAIRCIPTSCPSLNAILGGGFPYGRISETFGPEGSGKSTLALDLVANCQRLGGVAV